MARLQRLYIDAPLTADAIIDLGPERAHRLRAVLRLAPGAALGLFNAADGEWAATLDSLNKSSATARVTHRTTAPPAAPPPRLHLLFAPIKRAAVDWLVEKATELGVDHLSPVWTKRAHVDRVNLDRLGVIASEAAEQCERLAPPTLDAPVDLAQALDAWPADAPLFVAAERADAPPLVVAAASSAGVCARRDLGGLLIGPEGGFSSEELRMVLGFPFVVPVTLGPRILRAETAALAGLTLLQALRGDGG